ARATVPDMLAYAKNIFRPLPYSMVKYCRPEVAEHLRRLLAHRSYDAIICDFLLTSAVIPWEHPCPKILFTHNIEAVIWERHWRVGRNPLWKAISWREYRTMERVERMYLGKADHVLTVSDSDRDFFSGIVAPEKITTIPTGVDVDYFNNAFSAGSEKPETLVFTGSMDWLPNEDAILYFAEKILPLVQERVPGVTLLVVGRKPSARVQALAVNNPAIQVTGTVPDIRPYIKSGSVYVVPLRIGGGTRIKIFEAMAMAKAVVSTSIGAEGLPVTHGENILLADQPEDFAANIVELLCSAKERTRLGTAARQLVETRYSWPAVTDVLESALIETAGRGSKPPDFSGLDEEFVQSTSEG
ncbi:MAG: glycosyltransferase, partial [Actinomycetota bacterium]